MKRVLVIGGGAYQVPLIKRLMQRGIEAYCVDRNPEAPGYAWAAGHRNIDIMDAEGCLTYARELGIQGVATYGATLTLPTVSYIGNALGLPVLPVATAEVSKSKYRIKERLAAAGCNVKGDFFEMHTVADAAAHTFRLPCVIKPSDGSGSKGVSVVTRESELAQALQYACESARFGSFYAEGFVTGEEYTVEAFVSHGAVYIYAVVKTTFQPNGDGTVNYGHRTPSGLPAEQEQAIADEVRKAIAALEITMGSVNFDVILSEEDGKPYIIDCGIRIGQNLIASHLVPLSRGVSVIDSTIDLILGDEPDARPKKQDCVATRLLIYKSGVITRIKPMDGLIGTHNILDIVLRKGVGDIQPPYKEKSDTCGWVITQGSTPQEAEANAEKAKALLEEYIIIEPTEGLS